MAGPSKRVRFNDYAYEKTVLQWYEEAESDLSGCSEDEYE